MFPKCSSCLISAFKWSLSFKDWNPESSRIDKFHQLYSNFHNFWIDHPMIFFCLNAPCDLLPKVGSCIMGQLGQDPSVGLTRNRKRQTINSQVILYSSNRMNIYYTILTNTSILIYDWYRSYYLSCCIHIALQCLCCLCLIHSSIRILESDFTNFNNRQLRSGNIYQTVNLSCYFDQTGLGWRSPHGHKSSESDIIPFPQFWPKYMNQKIRTKR